MAHPVGLVNPGFTCIMNAALQAVFNLPSIQALLEFDVSLIPSIGLPSRPLTLTLDFS